MQARWVVPDAENPKSVADRRQVLKLAQNQEKHLDHGWFVIRNRTPAEVECNIEAHERDKREQAFFSSMPWNTLPKTRRGVQALKKFLADLLCTHIQMGFPVMLDTIQSRRSVAASQLAALGQPRQTLQQKRDYLAKIAESFRSQASAALDGRYGTIKNDKMKLRKVIRDANDSFMKEMKVNGHLMPFSEIPKVADTAMEVNNPVRKTFELTATSSSSRQRQLDHESHEPTGMYEEDSSSGSELEVRSSKVRLESNSLGKLM